MDMKFISQPDLHCRYKQYCAVTLEQTFEHGDACYWMITIFIYHSWD